MIDEDEQEEFILGELCKMVVATSIYNTSVYLTLLEFYLQIHDEEGRQGAENAITQLKGALDFYILPTKAVDYPGLPVATLQLRALLYTEASDLTPEMVNAVAIIFSALLEDNAQ